MGNPDYGSRVIAAFQAGQQARQSRQQQEQAAEERQLRIKELKMQMDRLKHEENIQRFKETYALRKGQPQETVPGVSVPTGIPGLIPNPQIPSQAVEPAPMQAPEELGGGMIPVPSLEKLLQQQALTRAADNEVTLPGGESADVRTLPFLGQQLSSQAAAERATAQQAATAAAAQQQQQFTAQQNELNRNAPAKRAPVPGIDFPLSPDVLAQQIEKAKATKTAAAIPATVKKDFATLNALDKKLAAIAEKTKLNPQWVRGGLTGVGAALGRIQEKRGTLSAGEELFRKEVKQNLTEQLHQLSGAAISPTEAARLEQALPDFDKMSFQEFTQAVNAARDWIKSKREALEAQFSASSAPTSQEFNFDPATGELVPIQ